MSTIFINITYYINRLHFMKFGFLENQFGCSSQCQIYMHKSLVFKITIIDESKTKLSFNTLTVLLLEWDRIIIIKSEFCTYYLLQYYTSATA